MNLRHEFNRISHLFDDGVEKTHNQAGKWVDEGTRRANKMARQVRGQVDTGARNIVTVEESFVQHLRDNPALYIIGAALLVGALIAKLLIEGRREPRVPLL